MIKTAIRFFVIGFVLASASPSRADIGVIVLEPVGALGFFTRVGHAGTYFSNICQDGSPVRMRLCLPGESGGVVSKYSPLSEHEDYDWAIVPFEEFMHGLASADFAPMVGTPAAYLLADRLGAVPAPWSGGRPSLHILADQPVEPVRPRHRSPDDPEGRTPLLPPRPEPLRGSETST